jgi:hypothetical protein
VNLEVETKLVAPLSFILPKQALVDLGLALDIEPVKRTSTVYLDSSNFDLLSCGVALRFRGRLENKSPLGKGIWAIKFSTPQRTSVVSRYEYESTGSYASIPSEFEKVLKLFGKDLSLSPIAILEAQRTTVSFNGSSGSKLFQIDDDVVTVRSSDDGDLIFREIEVELADPASGQEAERVVSLLRDHGAELSPISSKLERVLLQNMPAKKLNDTISRHHPDVVQQMINAACFVLGDYKSPSEVVQAFSALMFEQSRSRWRLKLADLLICELLKPPKLDRFVLPELLDRFYAALYHYCQWLRIDGVQNESVEQANDAKYGIRLTPFLELERKVKDEEGSTLAFTSVLGDLINEAFTGSEAGD